MRNKMILGVIPKTNVARPTPSLRDTPPERGLVLLSQNEALIPAWAGWTAKQDGVGRATFEKSDTLLSNSLSSFKYLLFIITTFIFLQSCTAVKPYQKSKINDSEMDLASRKAEKFEQSFYLYREGASGANGGKSGGGCGCN